MLLVAPAQQTIAMYHQDFSTNITLEEEEENKNETESEKESENKVDAENEKFKQHFQYFYKNFEIEELRFLNSKTQLFFSNYCVKIHLPPPEILL